MQKSDDIIYYNLNINTETDLTSGLPYDPNVYFNAKATVANTSPILFNPSEYYGSIVRLQISGYEIPVIQFLVQTPVTNINLGIYSFTLSYNGVDSVQTFLIFIPTGGVKHPVPSTGTPTQTFAGGYYFLYDYDILVKILNVALASAFTDLQGKTGGALAGKNAPFFVFDASTGLFSLFAEADIFDDTLSPYVKIYFNVPMAQFLIGLSWFDVSVADPNGKDNLLFIESNHGVNVKQINSVNYIEMSQQYVTNFYMSPLESILITTNMNIRPENYNITPSASQQSVLQNTGFVNVMTDFVPDISQPITGITTYKFEYNAQSLFRVFEIYQKSPLYTINAALFWTDNLGNIYPLVNKKGQNTLIKFMFIKKSSFKQFQV